MLCEPAVCPHLHCRHVNSHMYFCWVLRLHEQHEQQTAQQWKHSFTDKQQALFLPRHLDDERCLDRRKTRNLNRRMVHLSCVHRCSRDDFCQFSSVDRKCTSFVLLSALLAGQAAITGTTSQKHQRLWQGSSCYQSTGVCPGQYIV